MGNVRSEGIKSHDYRRAEWSARNKELKRMLSKEDGIFVNASNNITYTCYGGAFRYGNR